MFLLHSQTYETYNLKFHVNFFLQFSPICRPLASAAWCGPHPPHPLATPLLIYLLSNIYNFQQMLETAGLHETDIVATQVEQKSYALYQMVTLLINLSDRNHTKQGCHFRRLKTGRPTPSQFVSQHRGGALAHAHGRHGHTRGGCREGGRHLSDNGVWSWAVTAGKMLKF